jgi:hypothetical protein
MYTHSSNTINTPVRSTSAPCEVIKWMQQRQISELMANAHSGTLRVRVLEDTIQTLRITRYIYWVVIVMFGVLFTIRFVKYIIEYYMYRDDDRKSSNVCVLPPPEVDTDLTITRVETLTEENNRIIAGVSDSIRNVNSIIEEVP